MSALDSYLISLGIKGQDDVLAIMDNIRKQGDKLSQKKNTVNLETKPQKSKGVLKEKEPISGKDKIESKEKTSAIDKVKNIQKEKASSIDKELKLPKRKASAIDKELKQPKGKKTTPEEIVEKTKNETDKIKQAQQQSQDDTKKNTLLQNEAVKKFSGSVLKFAGAASSLDPTATISSVTEALGTSFSGISVLGVSLGRLPEGIAAVGNASLGMAKNALEMAKSSTAAYHQLADRNAFVSNYGNQVTERGGMSRNEMSELVGAISGSMGKIQQPLADELNKLTGTKDAGALARVGSGNWESTGTDKGWMLQQLSNGMQGLPPSIKQRFQAQLLKNNASEIQDMPEGSEQKAARYNAAQFSDRNEKLQ
jgi:hypothetical protein